MLWINETYTDINETIPDTSGMVCLIHVLFTGESTEEWMPPLRAVTECLYSPLNGREIRSSKILWGNVSSGTLGLSESAYSAVWGLYGNSGQIP